MKLSDFANVVSTTKGGTQVLIADLSLTVPKTLASAVAALVDKTTVGTFTRGDGSVGRKAKLGYVEVEFHLSSGGEGLGFLDNISRAEFEAASADDVFGVAQPAAEQPQTEPAD